MSNGLQAFIQKNQPIIEQNLSTLIQEIHAPEKLKEAMVYSLQAGGKRIRPLYTLAVLEELNTKSEVAATVASTIEMIHTYSLIHDDLPAMDDDDLRRGKPTNHVVFGEALAILAGDGLLTLAFGILARLPELSSSQKIELIERLSYAAGAEGMVGGQVLDILGEGKSLTLEELEKVHINKTGALLSFSILAGGIIANASEEIMKALQTYAFHIGLAFQIQDDILDIEGTSEQLGKTAGKDVLSEKNTYPSILTLDGAKEQLQKQYESAIVALEEVNMHNGILIEFANYITKRSN
ncbi:polyprenyl synthetase family protein [Psychrobacillus lasiicapitis]|uniref:Farnesyl diphosphate synthase n=1 Tax=Psychrobacillus lasiicapitis TaxID=1636719 RepID=A0A544TAR4_9BACI|nr:farnesyl diphosphate synthase [Psychrobacillus lasiicapitis]TQR14519.1 polyprenyl synthetase family protein [Psychrobacillus lasiicapitis]GGA30684.1 farnesyl-diphosphate synthase [Psychrobacillus lasiicapitis]